MSFDNRSSGRDGNTGNSDMESQQPSPCKSGCGFYGNPAFEGLCSVCYKEKVKVKCQMQSVPPVAPNPASLHGSPGFVDPGWPDVLIFLKKLVLSLNVFV